MLHDNIPNTSRGILNDVDTGLDQIERKPIVAKEQFNLLSTCDPSVSGALSVPCIVSSGWSNSCWAVCSVAVGEYVGSAFEDLDDIMDIYANGEDVGKAIYTIKNVLANEYNVDSTVHLGSLMMTTVINNIGVGLNQGTPIVARANFSSIFNGHFVVVCGIVREKEDIQSLIDAANTIQHTGNELKYILKYGVGVGGSTLYEYNIYLSCGDEFHVSFGSIRGDQEVSDMKLSYFTLEEWDTRGTTLLRDTCRGSMETFYEIYEKYNTIDSLEN